MPRKPLSRNLTATEYAAHEEDLYRQAALDLFASSSGLERYVIGIFGPGLIGSLALAINPFKQFPNHPKRISLLTDGDKVVRTRTITTTPSSQRREKWKRVSLSRSYARNPQAGLFDYYYTGPIRSETSGTVNRVDQPRLTGFIKDTTKRTRQPFSDMGEFELFAPRLEGASRSHSFLEIDQIGYNSIGSGQRTSLQRWTMSDLTGPEFRCSNADVQAMLPLVQARAIAAMQKNVYGMLEKVQPNHRNFELAYQIAELKDLPQTLRGTLQIWMSFERTVGANFFRELQRSARSWRSPDLMKSYQSQLGRFTGFRFDELRSLDKNVSSAYLTFKFGWQSMVQAVEQYLPSVSRTTADVNRLIARIGRDSSFRTKKTWVENETSVPNMTTSLYKDESILDSTVRKSGRRKCELRLMANFSLNFPTLDIPRLRTQLIRRKLGTDLTPSDLYNLIPWTWLVDWFGGLGDYVSLLDTMRRDSSRINYGFISYIEVTEVLVGIRGQFITTVSRNFDGVLTQHQIKVPFPHQSRFFLKYHLRKSIPEVANVKSYWDSDLDPNQTAIIGALIGAKSGSRGRHGVYNG